VRVFRGQIVRLFQLVLSAGKGAQRTVDQTGGGALSKANKGEAKMKKPYL